MVKQTMQYGTMQQLVRVIMSGDTDTWVYGMGLFEGGWLRSKCVVVQRGASGNYVNINLAVRLITDHPNLSDLNYPGSTLVGLYVLTGCDNISAFFRHTKDQFLQCFLEHSQYISASQSLLQFEREGCGCAVHGHECYLLAEAYGAPSVTKLFCFHTLYSMMLLYIV